jgi:V8-like Glu-specific endopeptidase
MQSKQVKLFSSVILIVMLAVALSLAAKPAAASAPAAAVAQSGGETAITSPENLAVAAPRPWTAAEMKAAKPYPMPEGKGSAGLVSDVTAGPTGPAGSAKGARPNAKSGVASTEATVDDVAAAINPAGYSYPGPFTRFHVGDIAAYTTYPLSTVGKLFFKQYGVSYVCSASVIALRAIVTAGHCVHKGNNLVTGWSTNVVFVPAYRNGAAPLGQWSVPSLRTYTDWYANGSAGDFDHDWGAGAITSTIGGLYIGQKVGYLGYAYNYGRAQNWWLLGYPQAAPFTGATMQVCNTSYAYDSAAYSGGPAPMSVGCDQTGGTSGGPWILGFGSSNSVNSVNSHRYNVRPLELSGPYANTDTYTIIFSWARTR